MSIFVGIDTGIAKAAAQAALKAAMAKRDSMAGQGDVYSYFTCSIETAAILDTLMGENGWSIDENTILGGLGSVAFARRESNREAGRKESRLSYNIVKGVLTVVNGFGVASRDLVNEAGEIVVVKGATLTADAFGLVVAQEIVAQKELDRKERQIERKNRDKAVLTALNS